MIMNAITSTRLGRLSNHYGDVGGRPAGERFYDAFQRYLKANRESLFDLTLAAASAEAFLDRGIDDIDPRLVDAIRVTNPSLSDEHLFGLSGEELQGAVNTANCHDPCGSPWMMEDTGGVRASAGRGRSIL